MTVRMGVMSLPEQPERGGRAMRRGTALRDAARPEYPCVTPAGYNLSFTQAQWDAGSVTLLKAVDAAGEEHDVKSGDAELAVYGLDFSRAGEGQAVRLVYAGHTVDAVVTVTSAEDDEG